MQKAKAAKTVGIGDMLGSKIVTAEGKHVGHVVDIQISHGPKYTVTALVHGHNAWLYRWHVLGTLTGKFGLRFEPDTIPWDAVDCFQNLVVTLKPGYEPGHHGKSSKTDGE